MNLADWHVLVVDDNPDNLAVASLSLRHRGAKVYTATNGDECIALLATFQPTFILLDISMPIMDGWQTLKMIKANKATKDIPVIALTAHIHAEERQRIFEAGFNGYIGKPFIPETLPERINAILSQHMSA
jgi:two-component system, cell cycle response regulator DivK